MTPAARLSAAIEVFAEIEARRRPAADALKDWGLAHRFAGSSDRAAIAGLVYDALRRKASSGWLMGEATPRAALLGMLRRERGLDVAAIEALCSGARFAPAPLSGNGESGARRRLVVDGCAAPVRGRLPGLARSAFCRVCSATTAPPRAQRWPRRAPLDLRVNTLKAEREEVLPKLAHLHAEPTRWSPVGLRIRLGGRCQEPGDPRRAGIPQGRRSKSRTKARSLPRCLPAPSPASR